VPKYCIFSHFDRTLFSSAAPCICASKFANRSRENQACFQTFETKRVFKHSKPSVFSNIQIKHVFKHSKPSVFSNIRTHAIIQKCTCPNADGAYASTRHYCLRTLCTYTRRRACGSLREPSRQVLLPERGHAAGCGSYGMCGFWCE
jgi:hypothetical protein